MKNDEDYHSAPCLPEVWQIQGWLVDVGWICMWLYGDVFFVITLQLCRTDDFAYDMPTTRGSLCTDLCRECRIFFSVFCSAWCVWKSCPHFKVGIKISVGAIKREISKRMVDAYSLGMVGYSCTNWYQLEVIMIINHLVGKPRNQPGSEVDTPRPPLAILKGFNSQSHLCTVRAVPRVWAETNPAVRLLRWFRVDFFFADGCESLMSLVDEFDRPWLDLHKWQRTAHLSEFQINKETIGDNSLALGRQPKWSALPWHRLAERPWGVRWLDAVSKSRHSSLNTSSSWDIWVGSKTLPKCAGPSHLNYMHNFKFRTCARIIWGQGTSGTSFYGGVPKNVTCALPGRWSSWSRDLDVFPMFSPNKSCLLGGCEAMGILTYSTLADANSGWPQ